MNPLQQEYERLYDAYNEYQRAMRDNNTDMPEIEIFKTWIIAQMADLKVNLVEELKSFSSSDDFFA